MKQHLFLLEYAIEWRSLQSNQDIINALLKTPPPKGSLICLPEMSLTGFDFKLHHPDYHDHDPGKTAQTFFSNLAKQLHCFILGAYSQAQGGHCLNTCSFFNPHGERVGDYHKLHPFSYSGENKHFQSGNSIELFDWEGTVVCPFICYDLRFPEIFRQAYRYGAEVFVLPANWPSVRHHHWHALLTARAIENQAFVAGINRIGNDPFTSYNGGSAVVHPQGQLMNLTEYNYLEHTNASIPKSICYHIEIDIDEVRQWRKSFPVRSDIKNHLFNDDALTIMHNGKPLSAN